MARKIGRQHLQDLNLLRLVIRKCQVDLYAALFDVISCAILTGVCADRAASIDIRHFRCDSCFEFCFDDGSDPVG